MAAHAGELSGYGSGVLVRPGEWTGWSRCIPASDRCHAGRLVHANAESVDDVNNTVIEHIIDVERHALRQVFAFIAIVTLAGFVLLFGVRLLRREAVQDRQLVAG